MGINLSSYGLNQAFQNLAGQNGDRQILIIGGPKATKERCVGFDIVHECFVEVGDPVLGVHCLEFFRAKLLDE